ncbi:hypothetical protein [Chromobacterium haemolyticum]|uniref:hypothetical protein n=1 Tax=Chromobacterium haemolyticum TaxID=394935 RepID=UPI0015938ABF|nr:hypothetical protein [Chromobacterium haemolyticum]
MICAGLRWRTGGRRAHIQRREIQFKAGALNGHGGSTQGKAQMRDAGTFAWAQEGELAKTVQPSGMNLHLNGYACALICKPLKTMIKASKNP